MSTIKTRFNAFALMAIAGLLVSAPVFACTKDNKGNDKGNGSGDDAKVTICHATNSQTNPYVVITVSTSSIDEKNNQYLNGHGDHTGGVWHQGIVAHSWGDIIPAFTSPKGAHYAGMNMNEAGKTILNNGCKVKTTTVKDTDNEDKGKPVTVLPVKDKDTDKDDHKAKDQGAKSDDVKVATAVTKVAGTGNVVATTATELPRTGAASIAGVLGVLGASTYAIARRFTK